MNNEIYFLFCQNDIVVQQFLNVGEIWKLHWLICFDLNDKLILLFPGASPSPEEREGWRQGRYQSLDRSSLCLDVDKLGLTEHNKEVQQSADNVEGRKMTKPVGKGGMYKRYVVGSPSPTGTLYSGKKSKLPLTYFKKYTFISKIHLIYSKIHLK